MDINTNSMLADITVKGEAQKKDFSKLPEVAYFRVQSRGLTGKKKDGFAERKIGGWAVLVSCKDGKGLRLAGDVGMEYGMKFKCEFGTREDAIAAGKAFVEKWGKVKAEKAKAPKAKGPTKADLATKVATLEALLATYAVKEGVVAA